MRFSHVVITRPEPEATELAGHCREAGWQPIVLPALGFKPAAEQHAWPPRADAGSTRHLALFTSPRAVEFGLPGLGARDLEGWEIAAIGAATAAALESAGHAVSLRPPAGGFRSEDLLEAPELSRDPGVAVIFAAPGGRRALRDGLAARGWRVSVRHVYRRVPRPPSPRAVAALDAAPAPVSVWTSASALDALAAGLPATGWRRLLEAPALVVSDRLGRHAAALGACWVGPLPGPSNAAILEGLHELARH